MATQKIEDDDYGVEVIRAPVAQAPEETKVAAPVQPKPAVAQPTASAAAKATTPAVESSDDEEDMYGEGVDIAGVKEENDGFEVEEGSQMTETLVIFDRNQFLLHDFKTNRSWQVGDVENDSIVIPEDSCIVMVDNSKHRTNLCQAIVTGGFNMGQATDQVLALGFDTVTKNTVESYICNVLSELPALPAPRFMHQTVITKSKTGSWSLVVAGGKSDVRNWETTVWSLDLLPYFRTGMKRTNEDGTTEAVTSQWQTCAPMQSARSNFAMIGLNNYIYAYGGISGSGQGEQAHHPVLASVNIECYTVASDSWATVTINTAPRLAAFSWCQMGDTAQIAVVGGTNGDIMSDETCVIDLQACSVQQSSFEFNTSMGKMCYQASRSTLHHIGGMNSEGIDYSVSLDNSERKWTENGKNHSLVLNASKLELCNSPSIYFN